jgi:V/A-type H+/Na+-transporting ATPase subunit A
MKIRANDIGLGDMAIVEMPDGEQSLAQVIQLEGDGWTDAVRVLSHLLSQGESIYQMMQVTGEEGITLEDDVIYQKALLLDMAYLQQDAYDPVDVSVPLERQREVFNLVRGLIQRDYPFNGKDEAHSFFTQLTGLLKNLNYAPRDSQDYTDYQTQIDELVQTLGRTPATTPV